MSGAVAEIHRDSDHIATGTQKCRTWSLTLSNPGSQFLSIGIYPGQLIRNITDGSQGVIISMTDNTITVTLTGGSANVWTNGDTYKIYATATYNSVISTIWTDKRHGHKANRPDQLEDGIFAEDRDLDEKDKNVFGPGEPEFSGR